MEYSKEDLIEAKSKILGYEENIGTEESKKIWEKNAQFWDDAMGDEWATPSLPFPASSSRAQPTPQPTR